MRISFVAILLVATGFMLSRFSGGSAISNAAIGEHPLIIEQGQGEARVRRSRPGLNPAMGRTSFTIKIDEINGGSPDFWFATETLLQGA